MRFWRPFSVLLLTLVVLAPSAPAPAAAQAPSQMTWAFHVTLAPTWFDPAEHTGIITLTS